MAGCDVYVREDGGPWRIWLQGTPLESALFDGDYDRSCQFCVASSDNAVNREEGQLATEASTETGPPLIGDINGDGCVGLADVVASLRLMTGNAASASLRLAIDVNEDGRIDLAEIAFAMDAAAK